MSPQSYYVGKFLKIPSLFWLKATYVLALMLATFTADVTFKFYYFLLPAASLLFPILFLLQGLIGLTDSVSGMFRFCLTWSLIHLLIDLLVFEVLGLPFHEFWIGDWEDHWTVYGMLVLGLNLGLVVQATFIHIWQRFDFQSKYVCVTLAALCANCVDLGFLSLTLYTYNLDVYDATWKLLTLTTFKLNVLMFCLPIGWLLLWAHEYKEA